MSDGSSWLIHSLLLIYALSLHYATTGRIMQHDVIFSPQQIHQPIATCLISNKRYVYSPPEKGKGEVSTYRYDLTAHTWATKRFLKIKMKEPEHYPRRTSYFFISKENQASVFKEGYIVLPFKRNSTKHAIIFIVWKKPKRAGFQIFMGLTH